MDNLTHTLTGLALAETGLGRGSSGATLALVVAANLPDVDLLAGLAGSASYLHYHRDLTHSVVGAPVLALALAGLIKSLIKGARFGPLLLCSVVGVATHVFMDLWTSYGTRVFAPFDRTWYAWDLVFILDPYVILLLVGAVLLARRFRAAGPRFATAALALILSYVGARAVLHAGAIDEARARIPSTNIRRVAALPSPFDPFRWAVLADTGDAYWTGIITPDGRGAPLRRRQKQPEDAMVARVRETSAIASMFLDFSRFPWLEVEETPEGTAVTWRDLRFEPRGRQSFVTRVVVGRDGRIRSETFRF